MSGEIAYVPGYTYDIFISYPFQADAGGWVSQLKEDVEKRLTEIRVPAPKVWLSASRHDTTGSFIDDIDAAVSDSAVLLTINSDPWRASSYCLGEKSEFEDKREKDPRTKRGHRRIVEVIQSLLPNKTAFTHWKDSKPVWFCGDPKKRLPERTFRKGDEEYKYALEEVCARLRDTLDALRDETIPVFLNRPNTADRPDEFCAKYYQKLRADIGHQYRLLEVGTEEEDLTKAAVSIHLLGTEYDPETEEKIKLLKGGTHPCVVVTDPELSSEQLAGHPVERLVRDLRDQETRYKNLKVYPLTLGKYDDLLRYIQSLLPAPAPEQPYGTQVYVICTPLAEGDGPASEEQDPEDREWKEFTNLIQDGGRNRLVFFEPGSSKHKENLRLCQGALLVWGKEQKGWFEPHYNDLVFARAYRKGKELVAKSVCLMKPDDPEKWAYFKNLPVHKAPSSDGLIDLLNRIDSPKLRGFLKRLREQGCTACTEASTT